MKLSKNPAIRAPHGLLMARIVFTVAVFSPLLPAQIPSPTQELVVPERFGKIEGASFTSLPFSRSKPVRVQHYYAPEFFKKGAQLLAIAFRPEGDSAFSAKTIGLEIYAGTGPGRVDSLSPVFAQNRGKDWVRCFGPKSIRLPAISRAKGPRDFMVKFVFDRPMNFDPKRGGLLIELVVALQPTGRYEFDLAGTCVSQRGNFGGPACKGSNGKRAIADSPTLSLSWGKPFHMRVNNLLPFAPALLIIGSKTGGYWGNVKLPFPLAALGAPGCYLNTDLLIVLGVVASWGGQVLVSTSVPRNVDFKGQWLLFQAAALDLKANMLGLSFSQGSKTQVCGPDPVARVFATGLEQSFGTLEYGLAPVTQFSFK